MVMVAPLAVVAGRVLGKREVSNPVHRSRDILFDDCEFRLAKQEGLY